MTEMLGGIPVLLNCDYLKSRNDFRPSAMTIFTGPVDEYFGFDQGRLAYRGQQRSHEYLPEVGLALPCGQVNNPDPAHGAHIRTLEWKHMMEPASAQNIRGTVLTRETPITPAQPEDYEYPFPDDANARLYAAYRERARAIPDLLVCGRLGEYRYYDMDQAIARAMMLAQRILQREPVLDP
jgi:UDP-galactopyranose mutase